MSFDLPVRTALERGDFYVTDSNAVALGMVDTWPNWPSGKLMLVGPTGSGKTHLAHVWCTESAGRMISAAQLRDIDIPSLCTGPICVENVDDIAGDTEAEEALFHLHNLALSQNQTVLFTASTLPATWQLALPDLASRLGGTTLAKLALPNDVLLSAVIAKLFDDRQIVPMPDVIPYLVKRMPRSFAAAGRVVAHLDSAALGTPKGVTRRLARVALAELDFSDNCAPD